MWWYLQNLEQFSGLFDDMAVQRVKRLLFHGPVMWHRIGSPQMQEERQSSKYDYASPGAWPPGHKKVS
jgi:hypothetical protein